MLSLFVAVMLLACNVSAGSMAGTTGLVAALPAHVYEGPKGPIAFVNVTVIPMDEERLLQGQTVIVKDEQGKVIESDPPSSWHRYHRSPKD